MQHAGKSFYSNLVPVLSLLVIVMLIVFVAFSGYLTNVYGLEITEKSYEALKQAGSRFDDRFRDIYNISYLVQQDSKIKKIGPDIKVTDRQNASRQLAYYGAVSTFADHVFYCTGNQDLVYLPSGSMKKEIFTDQQYIYENHTLEDLQAVIDSDRWILVWPQDTVSIMSNRPMEYVTVFVRPNQFLVSTRSRLGFLIPASSLREILSAVTVGDGSFAMVCDADMNPFLTVGDPAETVDLFSGADLPEDGVTNRVRLKNNEYYLQSCTSSVSGWRILTAMPVAVAESTLQRTRLNAALQASMLLLICGVIAFLILRHNYRPIMQLVRTAAPDVNMTRRDSEVDVVKRELQRLNRVSDELHGRLDRNRVATLHRLYGRLLHGYGDREILLQRAEENGISLDGPFRVASVWLHCSQENLPQEEEIRRFMESFFDTEPMVYHNESDIRRITVVLPFADSGEPVETVFCPFHEKLEEVFHLEAAVGISDSCPDFESLPEAYHKACQALDLRMLRGNSCICFWEEQKQLDNVLYVYPSREIDRLQQCLLRLDPENTTTVIREIIDLMKSENMQLVAVRMVCYDIVNTVVKTLGSLTNEPVLPDTLLEEIVSFDTVNELMDTLNQLISNLCESIRTLREKAMDDRFTVMLDYIRQNAFRPDFNVDTMAEYFNISVSNLSHYFRSHQGHSLSDYVQSLRFEESCRLLRETNDSIQTICNRTGMLNVSSFIRRFKQLYGVTPGAYRENSRASEPQQQP